ncbi:MAG: hypothetical protein M1823_008425, partial [Watsoniomyces obsoletus]
LEFFPPKTPEGVVKLATVRRQLYTLEPQFCSVTYGAGGSTQEGTFAAVKAILEEGVEAAPHFSCIGASRESIRENKGMYWGLVSVSGVAFSCATEFIPELNNKLKLVPFTTDFKVMITGVMLLDFGACWIIEKGLKWGFSDNRPKDIALRRQDQLDRENERKAEEEKEAQRKKNQELEDK